jgi:hypothetical protein
MHKGKPARARKPKAAPKGPARHPAKAAQKPAAKPAPPPKPAPRKLRGTPKSRLEKALPALDRAFGELGTPELSGVLERAIYLVVREGHPEAVTARYMASLKEHFIDWNEVRASRPTELARMLLGPGRVAVGTHKRLIERGRRVRELIEQVYGDRNEPSLEFLLEQKAKEQFEYLSDLDDLGVHNAVALVQWLSNDDKLVMVTPALATAAHGLGLTDSAAVTKVKKDLSALAPKETYVRLSAHLTQLGEAGEKVEDWPAPVQELLA